MKGDFSMAKFNLAIDSKAIAQGIYDDETLLFERYFTTASRSLPTVQLPEIICNNRSFLLNTVDAVTCTPRHFRVNAGSKEPSVRLPITAVDLIDVRLDGGLLAQDICTDIRDFRIEDTCLDLSDSNVLNEIISIIHLRQIALHIWKEDQLCPYFHTIGSLEYMVKALFYKEAVYTDMIRVEFDGCYGHTNRPNDDSLMHTILVKTGDGFAPFVIISRDRTITVPQWLQVNYDIVKDVTISTGTLSKLASFAMIHSKVARALIFNEPLERQLE